MSERVAGRRKHAFFALSVCGLVGLLTSRSGFADATAVPADIQATLLAKLERYDRNFGARAGDSARVLLVVKAGSTKGGLSADEMKSALARVPNIGGLPHQEILYEYKGADALAARCRADHIAVVYLTPGLDADLRDVRTALSNVDVLSLASSADYVQQGVVLGFELEAGAPKILFNLDQARLQHVDFPADLLRLMKVFR
jgi:hypothetical protein